MSCTSKIIVSAILIKIMLLFWIANNIIYISIYPINMAKILVGNCILVVYVIWAAGTWSIRHLHNYWTNYVNPQLCVDHSKRTHMQNRISWSATVCAYNINFFYLFTLFTFTGPIEFCQLLSVRIFEHLRTSFGLLSLTANDIYVACWSKLNYRSTYSLLDRSAAAVRGWPQPQAFQLSSWNTVNL
jgi:hypothetical protein